MLRSEAGYNSMDKKRDVQEVMREEGRRGRRRVDLEAQRARRENLAEFRKIWKLQQRQSLLKLCLLSGYARGLKSS